MSNPRSKKGKACDKQSEKPMCTKCGKKNIGECLVGTGNCLCCGESDHKERDCLMVKGQGKGNNKS